jgi:hypothetical protein
MEKCFCKICNNGPLSIVYSSKHDVSVTSLTNVVPIKTRVYFCDNCGHLQTAQFEGAATYYDTDYDILIDSEDEDQLLFLENDREVFRFDHQVEIFFKNGRFTEKC